MNAFCDLGGYLSVCVAEFHIWVTEFHARTRPPEADVTEHVSPLESPDSWRECDCRPGIKSVLLRSPMVRDSRVHLGYMCNCYRH